MFDTDDILKLIALVVVISVSGIIMNAFFESADHTIDAVASHCADLTSKWREDCERVHTTADGAMEVIEIVDGIPKPLLKQTGNNNP